MPYSTLLDSDPQIEAEHWGLPESLTPVDAKPLLESLDSAHEFSLERFLEVYRMVEFEDAEVHGYVFDDTILHAA